MKGKAADNDRVFNNLALGNAGFIGYSQKITGCFSTAGFGGLAGLSIKCMKSLKPTKEKDTGMPRVTKPKDPGARPSGWLVKAGEGYYTVPV